MTDELRFDLGRHDEAIATLKCEVQAMRRDLAEIKHLVENTKGGVRALIAVGSISSAITMALIKGLALLKGGSP